jgi:hypothetical protein
MTSVTLLDGLEVFAWVLFVVGAVWVPIKYHRAEYGSHQQKALLILGILPGCILLISVGVYKETHGDVLFESENFQSAPYQQQNPVSEPSLQCGIIQSVTKNGHDVQLTIQFEHDYQTRRFEFLDQGQNFEVQHRMCIRADHSIQKSDVNYLKQIS